jgi:hypothetical protein
MYHIDIQSILRRLLDQIFGVFVGIYRSIQMLISDSYGTEHDAESSDQDTSFLWEEMEMPIDHDRSDDADDKIESDDLCGCARCDQISQDS